MDVIETHRLRLRRFTPADLDELALIFSDPLVVRYLSPGRPATREETEQALFSVIRHWERHSYGRWAVVERTTNKLIGYGGLRCFDGTPELVYLLARPYWNRGLATEIARACLEYGFIHHKFERIVAVTQPNNLASRRVMDKVGLSYVRDDNFFNVDVVFYALTRADYLSQAIAPCSPDSVHNYSRV